NAYLRLGDVAAARRAYGLPLAQQMMPVEPLVKSQLEEQIARLADGTDPASVPPLRNPGMEYNGARSTSAGRAQRPGMPPCPASGPPACCQASMPPRYHSTLV